MLGIFPRMRSLMPYPRWPNFEHFHSISFPSPLADTTLAYLHRQGNALFSLLSCALNIEELASTWTVSWPELMHLVSGILISRSLTSPLWTLRNSADSSSG